MSIRQAAETSVTRTQLFTYLVTHPDSRLAWGQADSTGTRAVVTDGDVEKLFLVTDLTTPATIRISDSLGQPLIVDAASGALVTEFSSAFFLGGILGFDNPRNAQIFNSADVSAAGDTAVWTPSAGRRARLLGGVITVDGTCTLAVAGSLLMKIRRATTPINVDFRVALGAAAVTQDTDVVIPFDLGWWGSIGVINQVWNLNLSAALATGAIRATFWGTEE